MLRAPKVKTMSTLKVKAIGCIDFVLTVTTIVFMACQIIVPLSPYIESGPMATPSPAKFRIREWEQPENRPLLKPFEFWFVVVMFGTIGVMGICWSLVLVKVAVYPVRK